MTFNFGLYLLFEDSYQWQSDIINGRLWRLAKTPPYKHGIIAYGEHNRRCSLWQLAQNPPCHSIMCRQMVAI
jgi:hypothetical protein